MYISKCRLHIKNKKNNNNNNNKKNGYKTLGKFI